MQSDKVRDTKLELALRKAAHTVGLCYRVSVRPIPLLRRTADLVFTKAKIAVFVDGSFWHGCPPHHTVAKTNAMFWSDKIKRTRDRDTETDAALREAGWIAVRIWEHEDSRQAARHLPDLVNRRSGRTI